MNKIQLVSISGNKWPVLPYTSAILEKTIEKEAPEINERIEWLPYIWHTLDGNIDHQFEKIVQNCGDDSPKVVGLSFYLWNANRNIKLMSRIKEKYPNAIIVAGGSLIPENIEDIDQFMTRYPKIKEMVDIYVRSEGEGAWLEIIKKLDTKGYKKGNLYDIGNILWKDTNGDLIANPYNRNKEIYQLSPYLDNPRIDLCIDELHAYNIPVNAIWETNRGCPYSCAFCAWGTYTKQKIRRYDEELLDLEINWLVENVHWINLADANFGILSRDVDIAEKLVEKSRGKKLEKVFLSGAKNNKKNVVDITRILYQGGLLPMGILIGIQSTDDHVLEMTKRKNISWEKHLSATGELRELDIPYYFDLIIGLPDDTFDTFMSSVETLLTTDPSDLRIFPLALFPNSDFYQEQFREQYKFGTTDWVIFDGEDHDENEYMEVVTSTKTMSEQDFKDIKRISEMIEILHLGKITYYLAHWLNREYGIRIVDFYTSMYRYYVNVKESQIGQFVNGGYYQTYNGGSASIFRGNNHPFGLIPPVGKFRKQTLLWMCFMDNHDDLMGEIIEFVLSEYPLVDVAILYDCCDWQQNVTVSFDYDPACGKTWTNNHDWLTFYSGSTLESTPTTYSVSDTHVSGKPIIPYDSLSYMNVAGDCNLYPNKHHLFEHKQIKKGS